MIYENKTDGKIKVPVEDTKPKEYNTLYPGDTIECKSSVFGKIYEANNLSKVEVKAEESKAGSKKVETKQVSKPKTKKSDKKEA